MLCSLFSGKERSVGRKSLHISCVGCQCVLNSASTSTTFTTSMRPHTKGPHSATPAEDLWVFQLRTISFVRFWLVVVHYLTFFPLFQLVMGSHKTRLPLQRLEHTVLINPFPIYRCISKFECREKVHFFNVTFQKAKLSNILDSLHVK